MTSRVIFVVFLFLLPFALYALYLRFRGQDESAPTIGHPWTELIIAGLVLVAGSFVLWGVFDDANQRGVYVPPHLEDGRLVPGRVIPETETNGRNRGVPAETDRVQTGGAQ
jgi:hypothetical protein